MKGFVPTPPAIVDSMVSTLFEKKTPKPGDSILDPGCGKGAFVEGIIRWCIRHEREIPNIVGVELDPKHIGDARNKFKQYPQIEIRHDDFLLDAHGTFDYIIGNPPYVPITGLNETEKSTYRSLFRTATGRFDLYFLFFEQSLNCLKYEGRMVFITPEKFLYVQSAADLRIFLSGYSVDQIRLISEQSFGTLATYPAISTITNKKPQGRTTMFCRDGSSRSLQFPRDGSSVIPTRSGKPKKKPGYCTLEDLCVRISCGVATGSDAVFIRKRDTLASSLRKYAYPTIAGREISPDSTVLQSRYEMIIPYTTNGDLIPENQLGTLGSFLTRAENRTRLMKRTCVSRKPWYSFHETPPMSQILQQKILCKDITEKPFFRIDTSGDIVPRHSVYYILPKNPAHLKILNEYLNSKEVIEWLEAHCQRAANGFLRLQSAVLKKIPIPNSFLDADWDTILKPGVYYDTENSISVES